MARSGVTANSAARDSAREEESNDQSAQRDHKIRRKLPGIILDKRRMAKRMQWIHELPGGDTNERGCLMAFRNLNRLQQRGEFPSVHDEMAAALALDLAARFVIGATLPRIGRGLAARLDRIGLGRRTTGCFAAGFAGDFGSGALQHWAVRRESSIGANAPNGRPAVE
jgi:hypothetical protein